MNQLRMYIVYNNSTIMSGLQLIIIHIYTTVIDQVFLTENETDYYTNQMIFLYNYYY